MNVLLEKKVLLYTYYMRAVYISKHSDGECSIMIAISHSSFHHNKSIECVYGCLRFQLYHLGL